MLSGFGDDSANLKRFAELAGQHLGTAAGISTYASGAEPAQYTISNLDAGYYLVKSTLVPETGTHTEYILRLVTSITMAPKDSSIPTVEKKVYENHKYTMDGGYGTGYNDVADYEIGDTIPFKLIGSVPDMSAYETYAYTFHDAMSSGLSLDPDSVLVYLAAEKNDALTSPVDSGSYAIQTSGLSDGCTFEVSFADLKSVAGINGANYVIVTFDASLNSDAVVGLDGNPNEAYLTFSNNPYGAGTGKTPEDKAIVFTYRLDTTKVDGENNETKIAGAEFVLFNQAKTHVAKVESATGRLQGWVALTDISAGASAATLRYEQLSAYQAGSGSSVILRSAESTGLFSVIGLDDGTYFLREVKAPSTYNLLESDVQVVISADTENGQEWNSFLAADALTAVTVALDGGQPAAGDAGTGAVAITVENHKGSTLPKTGGIGTTVFYVVGGFLAVCAGILLVVRRRVYSEREK